MAERPSRDLAACDRRPSWALAGPLSGAVWDADAVRDDVRDYVIEHLGDPAAVAVGDETGDCTGTAGKVDNAQVAVYLTYASQHGHALSTGSCTCPAGGSPTMSAAQSLACLRRSACDQARAGAPDA